MTDPATYRIDTPAFPTLGDAFMQCPSALTVAGNPRATTGWRASQAGRCVRTSPESVKQADALIKELAK